VPGRDHITEATLSAGEDPSTGVGNRHLLERFSGEEQALQTETACIIAGTAMEVANSCAPSTTLADLFSGLSTIARRDFRP